MRSSVRKIFGDVIAECRSMSRCLGLRWRRRSQFHNSTRFEMLRMVGMRTSSRRPSVHSLFWFMGGSLAQGNRRSLLGSKKDSSQNAEVQNEKTNRFLYSACNALVLLKDLSCGRRLINFYQC